MRSGRWLPPLVAVMAAAVLSACGSSSNSVGGATSSGLQGLILRPAKSAPALALHNYTGQPVRLSEFRGRAVLVTFVYTHCPDVCPLIVSALAAAQRQLSPAARQQVAIVAVTVDPARDTPTAVRAFLAARGALGRMDYLVGTRTQLLPVWKRWEVGVILGGKRVTTGHTAIVYGITASGQMAVAYPANFTPAQIVHDVPLLART